jgi:SAM-dependent methyltransferase
VPDTFWETQWRGALQAEIPSPDGATWHNDIDRTKMKFIRRCAPTAGVAVEVGCGSARLLARVGREFRNLRLVAVDESAAALELAEATGRAFGVRIETKMAGAAALPLDNESVDFVLSGGLLEHFRDPRPILEEMLRVLRRGGVLYADVVPRKLSWYRRGEAQRMRESEWLAPNVYESSLGPADYRHFLADFGCRRIVIKDCGVYPPRIQHMLPGRRRLLVRLCGIFDGTPVASWWGWYFMFAAVKCRLPSETA